MLLIRNATVVNEEQTFTGAILVDGERIKDVFHGEDIPFSVIQASEQIDAEGCLLLPGAIDMHVHFRDPGLTHKGDMATESAAAVAGGVTSFLEMPNTKPATVTLEDWEAKMERAAAVSSANYGFWMGATNTNLEVLKKADYSRIPGIKLFMGSSTGNMLVSQAESIENLFRFSAETGVVVAAHCESEPLIRAHRESLLQSMGTTDDLPLWCHRRIRDSKVCYSSSSLAIEMAERLGARLHIMHVSTKEELSLLDDKLLKDKKITAETCPHYLWFAEEGGRVLLPDGNEICNPSIGGAAFKCNPAIKGVSDREALRQAAASCLIDTFGTDHAPHLPADKQGGALKAASGTPSVQFFLPLLLDCLSAETVVRKASHNPASLLGIEGRGYIRDGYFADLVLVRPGVSWTVRAEDVMGPCGWSPYEGVTLHHRVERCFVNGVQSYNYQKNPHQVLSGNQKSITFARRNPFGV